MVKEKDLIIQTTLKSILAKEFPTTYFSFGKYSTLHLSMGFGRFSYIDCAEFSFLKSHEDNKSFILS